MAGSTWPVSNPGPPGHSPPLVASNCTITAPSPPFLLSLFSLPYMSLMLHVSSLHMAYTDSSSSWNHSSSCLVLLRRLASVAVCQLACLPFSSLSLSLCLRLRSSVALLPPANRAEPGCGSIRPLVGASLRHCHLVNKSSACVTVVLACHISHVLPVVM